MAADLLTPQDIIDDFLSVVDGKEWIIYESLNDDGLTNTTVEIGDENDPRCLPFGTSTDQWIDENLIASSNIIIWHILAMDLTLAGVTPKVGDKITDKNGEAWEVRGIKRLAWRTRFRLVCLKV